MVATTFIAPDLDGKWLKYLALSLLVNLLIVSVTSINKQPILSQETPMLKVNLMALSALAPEPVKQQVKPLPPPAVAGPKKVLTERQAQKKIPAMKPAAPPQSRFNKPKPVAKKPPQELAALKPAAEMPSNDLKPMTEKPPQELAALKPATEMPGKDLGKQASSVIHKANYRKQTPPVYPRRALELGQEGTVTLHAEVTPAGLPRDLKIAKSSGHRLLDMAALAAVKKWEFEPTNVNGNTITSWVRVPVRFVIQR